MLAQWSKTNGPFGGAVHCFTVYKSNVYCGTDSVIFCSNDNGVSWTAVDMGSNVEGFWGLASDSSKILAGSIGYGIFLSTDDGTSWNPKNTGLTNTSIRTLMIKDNIFLAGTDKGGIFRSTDDGTTWTACNSGLVDSIVYAFASMDTNIFAGLDDGVYRSTDKGLNWTIVNGGLTIRNVYALAVINKTTFAGTYGGKIFRSTNNGSNWIEVNLGLMPITSVVDLAVCNEYLFAATNLEGIFRSTDSGLNWTAVNEGLTSLRTISAVANDTFLFTGTFDNDAWRRQISEMITSVPSSSVCKPHEFILCQNYPNPFNPTTEITFRVGTDGYTSLRVYDILGREVAILTNEKKPSGSYQVQWNAANMPSGVYLYQLETEKYTETKKLILLK